MIQTICMDSKDGFLVIMVLQETMIKEKEGMTLETEAVQEALDMVEVVQEALDVVETQVVEMTLPLVPRQEEGNPPDHHLPTLRRILSRICHQVLVTTIHLGEKIHIILDS